MVVGSRPLMKEPKYSSKRSCFNEERLNHRLLVALGGEKIAFFDLWPVVAEFLRMKDKRHREQDLSLYK